MSRKVFSSLIGAWVVVLGAGGCHRALIDRPDRDVNALIEQRQRAALGASHSTDIGSESGSAGATDRIYSFTPRTTTSQLPAGFRRPPERLEDDTEASPTAPAIEHTSGAESDLTSSIFTPEQMPDVHVFGVADALAYAMRHARSLQSAKEAIYIAALDLTLERHLWTPLFVSTIQASADFTDPGGLNDYERSATAVSDLSVSQRLPYGGALTARVINTLVRDLERHVTSAESGSLILSADIPLLRGAGRVAYESRYVAERELIYAVRTFERFRRTFIVAVASLFFDLQESRAAIKNTHISYESRLRDWERADFINRMGRSKTIFEAPRAKSSLRQAEAALVSAKERYATALDSFKIFIGMPVEELLDVMYQDDDAASATLDELLPQTDVRTAVDVALKYRLDLLNDADAVDDARRGILIARNRILPDLDFSAAATFDSDPTGFNSMDFNLERANYRTAIELRMDDRKTERNAYRASLVALRRAERDYEEAVDTVRADVRRALRRIGQQENLREIQALNVEENEFRLAAAREQFALGKSTNQDVVDAEDDLLAARNDYAGAVSAYRIAILQFRLDTGTLRVTDDGRWYEPQR